MTETYVAAVAQQTTNISFDVTVIYTPVFIPSRSVRVTYGAFEILSRQHGFVLFRRYPELVFTMIGRPVVFVFLTPLLEVDALMF